MQLVDEVPDVQSRDPNPEMILQHAETAQYLRVALGCLKPVDRQLIERRFGLDQDEMTLQELAMQLGVSPQAVHKRLKSAIARLRPPVIQIFRTRCH